MDKTCVGPRISIMAAAAVTPEFSSMEALFAAWCGGRGEVAKLMPECLPDWHAQVGKALAPVMAQVRDRRHCALILGTAKANMPAIEKWMNDATNPRQTDEMPELMSDSLGKLAQEFNISGPCYCVSTACTSGLAALIEAASLVEAGVVPEAIAIAAETITGFVEDGFKSLKAIASKSCKPFDQLRDGLRLGSAAAACVLRATVAGEMAQPGVMIDGWGSSADAVHLTAPDREAGGLIRAIQGALAMAACQAQEIDAVVLHGTGTRYNDAMEATAIRTVFTHQPALTGVKGLIGHTLGAAGLIETLLATRCLEQGIVPPVAGLAQKEYPDLNWVTGPGRPARLRCILKTASGFGGMNAAVILSRREDQC